MRIHRRTKRVRAPGSLTPRTGFGLIELIVAIVLITFGMLGMVALSAVVIRQLTAGNRQIAAANLAQGRFERLRGVPCASLAVPSSGSEVTGAVTEKWSLQSGNATNPGVPTIVLTDTVSYSTATGTVVRAYSSMRSCP